MTRDTKDDPIEPKPVGDWWEVEDEFDGWSDVIFWFVSFVGAIFLVAFIVGAVVGLFGL